MTEFVKSIKGTDTNIKCRGFQFEIGKTYTHDGMVSACDGGFHACPIDQHPLSVFEFYAPGTSRYWEVTQFVGMSKKDTKLASATITIDFELSIGDLVMRAWDYVWDRSDKSDVKPHATEINALRHLPGIKALRHLPGIKALRHLPAIMALRHLPAIMALRHLPAIMALRHLPGIKALRHLPAIMALRHLPGIKALRHLPAIMALRHLPAIMALRHLPAIMALRHLPGIMALRHLPAIMALRHLPAFVALRHLPAIMALRHLPGIKALRHLPAIMALQWRQGATGELWVRTETQSLRLSAIIIMILFQSHPQ